MVYTIVNYFSYRYYVNDRAELQLEIKGAFCFFNCFRFYCMRVNHGGSRPLNNVLFCFSARKMKIITGGIH